MSLGSRTCDGCRAAVAVLRPPHFQTMHGTTLCVVLGHQRLLEQGAFCVYHELIPAAPQPSPRQCVESTCRSRRHAGTVHPPHSRKHMVRALQVAHLPENSPHVHPFGDTALPPTAGFANNCFCDTAQQLRQKAARQSFSRRKAALPTCTSPRHPASWSTWTHLR